VGTDAVIGMAWVRGRCRKPDPGWRPVAERHRCRFGQVPSSWACSDADRSGLQHAFALGLFYFSIVARVLGVKASAEEAWRSVMIAASSFCRYSALVDIAVVERRSRSS
jgi:hypothetical protein